MFWNHIRRPGREVASVALSGRGFQTFSLGVFRLYILFWNSGILNRRRKGDVRLEAG